MSNYELNKLNKLIEAVTNDLQECKEAVSTADDSTIDIDDIMQNNSFYIKEVMRRAEVLQGQHVSLNNSDGLTCFFIMVHGGMPTPNHRHAAKP